MRSRNTIQTPQEVYGDIMVETILPFVGNAVAAAIEFVRAKHINRQDLVTESQEEIVVI